VLATRPVWRVGNLIAKRSISHDNTRKVGLNTMMSIRIVRRGLAVGTVTVVACFAALALVASSALATPKGGFAVFSDCPLSNPAVTACIVAKAEGGEFTVGKKTVPITNTITLQGGLALNEETGEVSFVAAADGNTLSKSPQKVPGGLVGIEGLGGEVTATTELAGPASSIKLSTAALAEEEGTALSLPVKLKLGNPFLGEKCYGGSEKHPIVLNLTTGTTSPPPPNKPIKGSAGEFTSEEEGGILVIRNNSLVNNEFAAPGVRGCGFFPPIVDPLVDLGFGVPAASGKNTAILTGTIRIASAEEVEAHS
jgi:hypothetical protein